MQATGPVAVLEAAAAELHWRDPFEALRGPSALTTPQHQRWVVCDLTRSAIILGSRQSADVVDASEAADAGFDVVRRRSGGGAVVLGRGDHVWIDTVSDPTALPDDVRASMVAVGERWANVLAQLVDHRTSPDLAHRSAPALLVHDGPVTSTPHSEMVCFAGVGPGEVLLNGRKLVGLSQRRTRQGSWIQATVYRSRPPLDVGWMLRPAVDWSELPPVATLADLGLGSIKAVDLAAALARG